MGYIRTCVDGRGGKVKRSLFPGEEWPVIRFGDLPIERAIRAGMPLEVVWLGINIAYDFK